MSHVHGKNPHQNQNGEDDGKIHYKTDVWTYQNVADILGAYVDPVRPLQNVWAGDDPNNPQWTVPLVFPDETVAEQKKQEVDDRVHPKSKATP